MKTKLHEGTKMHKDTFEWGKKITRWVNFAQVTILHRRFFLHESKLALKVIKKH